MLQKRPTVVCDTAHNEAGFKEIFKQLTKQRFEKLHIVLGFVRDKPIKNLLELFPKKAKYYFVKPNISRAIDANSLMQMASEVDLYGTSYASVIDGIEAAVSQAKSDDFIYVGGSTFVVAEVINRFS